MRKLVIFLIVIVCCVNITTANDCKSAFNDKDTGDFVILKNFKSEKIMPKVALETALNNLQKFCCLEESTKNDLSYCENINTEGYFPNSAYLFDHLLDVYLRRLDAKTEDEHGKNLLYGLDPDPKGLERRTFITEHANNKDGSVPVQIENEYKKFWERKSNSLVRWNPNSNLPWSEENFENYNDRSLVERYIGACEISTYWYLTLLSNENKERLVVAYENCTSLINTRIKNEYEYTKAILMQKGNVLLNTNVGNYLDSYFSQDKLMSLQSLVFDIKNIFAEVNKAVIELVQNCS